MSHSHHKDIYQTPYCEIDDLVRLWVLRMLVALNGHRRLVRQYGGFSEDSLAEFVGLEEWLHCKDSEFSPPQILAQLRQWHHGAERAFRNAEPKVLEENISRLCDFIPLNKADCRILEFVICLHADPHLKAATDLEGNLSSRRLYHVLATTLDLPERDVRASLSPRGLLTRSGLLSMNSPPYFDMESRLMLFSGEFAGAMLTADTDPLTPLRSAVAKCSPPLLALCDFEHLATTLAVLRPYLRHTVATRKRGVNIFLYGPPGTGKSELSRVLAQEIGCELFEVAGENEEGYPQGSQERLNAYRIGQNFLAASKMLLLFDEVEDIFGNGHIFWDSGKVARSCKAWINRMLEENPVPTLWVANSADGMDDAFLRRFDLVVEMPVPPRKQRERIIKEACNDLLPAETIRRLAGNDNLAPATVNRAVSVVQSIQTELDEQALPKAVEQIISGTLKAQGHLPLTGSRCDRLPETYDPAFLNVDADLLTVADGLMAHREGRICLYGPPGTGKTAFARWLAERLGLQLSTQRASDLLSKYVGQTEKYIAAAFRRAEQDDALLLIDEVDSFLQDRRQAQRSWEVTQINEMLTQMERFPGILVASTNLMDGIDQAALRRFDLKLKFGYLQPDQAWQMFVRQCAALTIPAPSSKLRPRVSRLSVLTPGDFATVARQHRFHPVRTPSALLSALEQECLLKEDGKGKTIGF